MKEAKRIQALPPYLFAQIEDQIARARQAGVDVISLGIGDPDQPTDKVVVDTLVQQASVPVNHQYPTSAGLLEYRQAVASWYKTRFGVQLDPDTEITALIGSKEGIANMSFCFLDPGDVSLVPDPGYPVYGAGALFAGGEPYTMPLLEENDYVPDLTAIPTQILQRAKLMWLNYPNNPTGATATSEFFAAAIALAKKHDILICHDAAYTEVAFDGVKPLSLLEMDGAKEIGVEFHSLSKTYNMTGWRIGWAAGCPNAVQALRRFKTNVDSGIFQPIQYAAIQALSQPFAQPLQQLYQRRRDLVVTRLQQLGWPITAPEATIYIWAKVPSGYTSIAFASDVFEKTGVVITPGIGYGEHGEGYFRISICVDEGRIEEAFTRWNEAGIRFGSA